MADKPELFSERLEALTKDFNAISDRLKAANTGLTHVVYDARMNEFHAQQDATLREYADDLKAVNGHDVIFLVNRSKPMGEGYDSAVGTAVRLSRELFIASGTAQQGRDLGVSLTTWDKEVKSYGFGGNSNLDKAYEKAGAEAADFVPVAREILTANTPDKQGGRQKHYLIISTGNMTDSLEHTAQLLNTALQMNPRLTIDFVTMGAGEGNIRALQAQLNAPAPEQQSGLYTAETPADLKAAVIRALKTRIVKAQAPAVEPPPPPKPVERSMADDPPGDGQPENLSTKKDLGELTHPPAAAAPEGAAKPAKSFWSRLKPW